MDQVLNASNTKISTATETSETWSILIGVLLTVASLGLLIIIVKSRILQRYFGSYREALLPDGDGISQFSIDGTLTSSVSHYGMRDCQDPGGRVEDDDGFIEDNYISENEKVKPEKEEEHPESDDDLDIHFSI